MTTVINLHNRLSKVETRVNPEKVHVYTRHIDHPEVDYREQDPDIKPGELIVELVRFAGWNSPTKEEH